MGKKIIAFCDNKIEKQKFYRYKNPIFLKDVQIDNLLISNKISKNQNKFTMMMLQIFMMKKCLK